MDITKKVAKIRFLYHANMLSVNNILNQLKIRNNEKAEAVGEYHTMECFDCLERLGFNWRNIGNKKS